MLPANVESLVLEQVHIDLKLQGIRPPAFGQRALAKSVGGEVIQPARLALALSDEITLLAKIIAEAMKKVLQKVQLPAYDKLTDDLLNLYDAEFSPCLAAIRAFGLDHLTRISASRGSSAPQWFDEKANLAKAASQMEIKLLAAEIAERALQRHNSVTFTIQNSQVGIIQTGEKSSIIGSTVSFSTEHKEQLITALRDLRVKLETVEAISPTSREELREIAQEVETELAKPKPNKAKIGGLLSMILASIKGVGTLATIYEVIQTVLRVFGIHSG